MRIRCGELRVSRPSVSGRVMRTAAACTSMLAVAVFGCSATVPKIDQSGDNAKASADSAAVMAKVNDVTARLDLAFRKIDNSREINQDAARDIVNKEVAEAKVETIAAAQGAVNNIGLGQWAQTFQTLIMFVYLGWDTWCGTRRNGNGAVKTEART